MGETKLIGDRNYLFLDEQIERGVTRDVPPAYPPLKAEEVRFCKVIANVLFVSESAIQWMYFNAQKGDKDAGRRVLSILASKPVRLTPAR
jgi:hypothetical protein